MPHRPPVSLLLNKNSKVPFMRSCTLPQLPARLGRVGLLFVVAALSGCDVPTDIPIFDVRWVFPIEDQSISVVEFLPTNVDTIGGNFQVDVAPFALDQTLGFLCAACVSLNGLTVPKPAFTISYNQSGTLPTDVVSVVLVSGSISLGIQNNLGFDPIRPAAASPGTMTMTVYDGSIAGRVLGSVVLDGTTDAIPTGNLTTIPIALAPGTVTPTILTVVDLVSPLGDAVLINTGAGLNITASVGSILVSSATINVDGTVVNIDQTTLDVSDIDADVVTNIQTGSLILDVQNPFGVAIDVVVEIGGPGIVTLQRNLSIGSGPTTSAALSYTGADLQSFLGKTGVFFRGSGTVTSPGVPATVTPTQEASLEASLDVTLELGR